jgi:hypothetical protein
MSVRSSFVARLHDAPSASLFRSNTWQLLDYQLCWNTPCLEQCNPPAVNHSKRCTCFPEIHLSPTLSSHSDRKQEASEVASTAISLLLRLFGDQLERVSCDCLHLSIRIDRHGAILEESLATRQDSLALLLRPRTRGMSSSFQIALQMTD